MPKIKRYGTETFSKVAQELKGLGLSTRVIANLFGFPVSVVEGFVSGIASGKSDLSIIWKRFCALKLKESIAAAEGASFFGPSSGFLMLEVLSEYLHINILIGFVEQTIVTMRQLRSLTVPKEESGYALLLQGIFKRGILPLQSRGDLRIEAERFILHNSPEKPRSMQHIRETVCRVVTEQFRHQILPPWPKNAVRVIDGILLKELDLKFDSREYFVIAQHFGLSGLKRQTYRKIAKELHISAARVNQIKDEAFERLRQSSSRKLLESFVMTLGEEEGTEKQSV